MRLMVRFYFDPATGGVELRQFSETFRKAVPDVQVEAFTNLRYLLEEIHAESLRMAALKRHPQSVHPAKGIH
jgi:hypothetical protein